jgi:hypothetical protein
MTMTSHLSGKIHAVRILTKMFRMSNLFVAIDADRHTPVDPETGYARSEVGEALS